MKMSWVQMPFEGSTNIEDEAPALMIEYDGAMHASSKDAADEKDDEPTLTLSGPLLNMLGFEMGGQMQVEIGEGVIRLSTVQGSRQDEKVHLDVEVDDALRIDFQEAALRAGGSPSKMVNLLMQAYIDVQGCAEVDRISGSGSLVEQATRRVVEQSMSASSAEEIVVEVREVREVRLGSFNEAKRRLS